MPLAWNSSFQPSLCSSVFHEPGISLKQGILKRQTPHFATAGATAGRVVGWGGQHERSHMPRGRLLQCIGAKGWGATEKQAMARTQHTLRVQSDMLEMCQGLHSMASLSAQAHEEHTCCFARPRCALSTCMPLRSPTRDDPAVAPKAAPFSNCLAWFSITLERSTCPSKTSNSSRKRQSTH